jgi:hypothetical protein
MERGARQMAEEARKLRDSAYRDKQIAEHAARGERLTHEELLNAIPKMEAGSKRMLEGAAKMREGAKKMRKSASRDTERNVQSC